MKRIRLLCICFLFMILSSCTPTTNKSQLTTNILNCIDEVYTVYTLDDSVNLREYIVCDDEYNVKHSFKEYNSKEDSLEFTLKDGNNIFTVIHENENIKINVYKNYYCTVNYFILGKIVYTEKVLDYTTLNESVFDIEEFSFPSGYKLSGTYSYFENNNKVKVNNLSEITVKNDLNLTIEVDIIPVELTFINENDEYKRVVTTSILSDLPALSKEGYSFLGWTNGDVVLRNGDTYLPEYGTKFEALFELKRFVVFFNYPDKIEPVSKVYCYGDKIERPVDPEQIGYKFIGWQGDGKLFDFDNDVVKSFLMLTPVFEPIEYNITYKFNGEEITDSVQYYSNFNLLDKELPGYNFEGWYLDGKLFKETQYIFANDIILVGKYSKKEYKIIYNEFNKEQSVLYSDNFTLFIPNRDGYLFLYWEYNGEEFKDGTFTYLEDVILTPVFKKESQSINVNFESFGGTVNNLCEVNDDGSIILPNPLLKGYKFMYWCTDKALTKKVDSIYADTYNNEVLYAYYELDSDDLKDSFIITRVNEHASTYDELAIFDGDKSGFTSLYWHKVAVKKSGDNYYISKIAKSGDKLSSLGVYDFVILCYSDYSGYKAFVNGNYAVGDKVIFLVDPTLIESGVNTNIMSITKQDVGEDLENIKTYLEDYYKDYSDITEDIDLVSNYNQYAITWQTSNKSCITSSGKFIKPYVTRNVTLTAFIDDLELYSFEVIAIGEKDVSESLATGYIYTPYNTITQNAMDTLDIIYCAFLDIDANGEWTNLTRVKNNLNNYILPKAKLSGTKVVISVNQENQNGAFSSVSASPTLREKLATNILNFIIEMGIDGIDIDWETPTSSEATNFTLLMKAIYEKVKGYNSEYLVTAAIGGGKWAPPKYDLPNSKNYLDYINLMTYSMASGSGYYQNSLYKSTKSRTLVSCSIEESIEIYNNLGVENRQILVGIPFYVTVQTDCEGPGSKTGNGKSIWYNQMFTTYKLSDTMKEYFDYECGVPYRYDEVNKIFISFDNEESIKIKCDYINTLGLAGIMYWQYGQDVDDMLSNAIREYIRK